MIALRFGSWNGVFGAVSVSTLGFCCVQTTHCFEVYSKYKLRERERWVTNKGKKTWEGRRGGREIKGVIFFVVVLMISCEVNALTVLVLLSLFMRFLFSSETQFLSV